MQRVLHMSALGADSHGVSMYQRSKGDGEAALHAIAATDSLALTIFRPSVVFGPGDAFLNTFANLQRSVPVLPLAMPDARFQPVFVGDVVRAFVNTLDLAAAHGKTYELGGPTVYTLEQLVRYCGTLVGRQARIVRLPDALARLQASVFECLPGGRAHARQSRDDVGAERAVGPLAPEPGSRPRVSKASRPRISAGRSAPVRLVPLAPLGRQRPPFHLRVFRNTVMKLVIGDKNYSSWSMRPWLLLAHFGIPFDEIAIELRHDDTAARIREYSPSGKVPCLIDDHGVAIWDSLAIAETLAERYPQFPMWPADPLERAHALRRGRDAFASRRCARRWA